MCFFFNSSCNYIYNFHSPPRHFSPSLSLSFKNILQKRTTDQEGGEGGIIAFPDSGIRVYSPNAMSHCRPEYIFSQDCKRCTSVISLRTRVIDRTFSSAADWRASETFSVASAYQLVSLRAFVLSFIYFLSSFVESLITFSPFAVRFPIFLIFLVTGFLHPFLYFPHILVLVPSATLGKILSFRKQ